MNKTITVLGFILSGIWSSVAGAQTTLYMAFDGIESEALSIAWEGSNSASVEGPGGDTSGRSSFAPLELKRYTDAQSASFLQMLSNGGRTPEVTIRVTQGDGSGGRGFDFMIYRLRDVILSRYTVSSSGDRPLESIELKFAEFELEINELDERGNVAATGSVCWNIAENRSCSGRP